MVPTVIMKLPQVLFYKIHVSVRDGHRAEQRKQYFPQQLGGNNDPGSHSYKLSEESRAGYIQHEEAPTGQCAVVFLMAVAQPTSTAAAIVRLTGSGIRMTGIAREHL
ncbi:hypothetical protein PoB_006316200 [Plakobranchus ocellatus]|uniref:Uncharacterized protein n=1 Tax=Plakobranchus ocellatus TaxID=259542 RepID=A0AAV4CXL5_9GAST|nr:hypothetical protein PoB_006316200 [Plakobranchus ocellatus]